MPLPQDGTDRHKQLRREAAMIAYDAVNERQLRADLTYNLDNTGMIRDLNKLVLGYLL
jgi:hypothetical protein